MGLISLPALGGCRERMVGATPNRDRITLGTTAKIRTLDPADVYNIPTGNLLYNLGDRLYTFKSGTNDLQPQLATALPKISSDGLTYTIPLRKGVKFHDGTAFNAQAMAFSIQRFIQNGGQPSFLLSDTVADVRATGTYELTVKLKQPFVGFPSVLAFSGLCAVSPKAYAIGEGKFKPDQFVGTGPYKLARYGNDSLRLDVFDQYWGEKPKNKGIDIQLFSSSAILFNTFQIGGVDIAYQNLDLDQVRSLKEGANDGKWQVIEGRGDGIYYLTLNLKSKPLNQRSVRQAIATLIDRPLIRDRIFRGQVDPLYSLVPSTLDAYRPVFKEVYGDGNLAKTKAILREAGYSEVNPLVIELWYRSNITSNGLVANLLKAYAQLNAEGLMRFDLKSVESATAYENLNKGAYPTFILDWAPDYLDPDNYLQPFVDCTQGTPPAGCKEGASKEQGSFYMNPQVNRMIRQARKETNARTRQQLLIELQNIVVEDVPFIPLWQSKEFLFAQKEVTGAKLEVTQKVPFGALQKAASTK
jgi:peptide/nickel transport system substrate-binding protein